MSLNIKVDADPSEIRQTSSWLRGVAQRVHGSGSDVRGASGLSESGWEGQAGPAFRETMGKVAPGVDKVSEQTSGLHKALDTHADDIDTVKSRMQQARDIATKAGLKVTKTKIFDPGPPPPAPPPFPKDHMPTPQEHNAYVAMQEAQHEYIRKLNAFYQCSQIVDEARKKEHDSQSRLNRFLSGQMNSSPFTITNFATGLAGATLAQNSKLQAIVNSSRAQAAGYASKLGPTGINFNDPDFKTWKLAAYDHAAATVNANEAAREAQKTRLQRAVNSLPDTLKNAVTKRLGVNVNTGATTTLGKALPFVKSVPVMGTILSAGSIAVQTAQGADARNAASNTGVSAAFAFVAGATVTLGSGPIGWSVAAATLTGSGSGFAMSEWGPQLDQMANASGNSDAPALIKPGIANDWVPDWLKPWESK